MAQISKPDADITDGGWKRSDDDTNTNLYQLVSDGTTTYIYEGSAGSPTTCTLGLENLSDPSSSSSHTITVSGKYVDSASNVTFYILQGASIIGGGTGTLTTSFASYTYTLTASEADSISDYNDLRIRIGTNFAFDTTQVSHAQFSVPDAGGGGGDGGADPYTTKLGNAEFTFRGLTDIGG